MTQSAFEEAVFQRADQLELSISSELIRSLERYYHLLARWNQRINLTSLEFAGFPTATLDRLIFEPLVGANSLSSAPARWFDIGSGGGSPALPMRLLRPKLDLTMVEPKGRKAAFLREAVRHLQLDRVVVVTGRIEDAVAESQKQGIQAKAELVTVRALRLDQSVSAAILSLMAPESRLLVFGGTSPSLKDFRPISEQPLPGGSRLRVFSRV